MSHRSDNRRKAFAEVVTIDAWHDCFDLGRSKVDLHADVVFGTARVGGERESQVRFRLSIKRADVVVVLPPLEPVSVDQRSVSRDSPFLEGTITEVVEQSSRKSSRANFASSLSFNEIGGSVSGEVGKGGYVSESKRLEVSGAARLISVTQSKTSEGHYRWSVEPCTTKILEGRPWDANSQPRLKLVDQRKDQSKGIPPSVRVEVWCRREDLSIEDLEIKDENLWQTVKRRSGFANRMAAAESYIRDRLSEEGLEVHNIEDKFGQLAIGSTIAESS